MIQVRLKREKREAMSSPSMRDAAQRKRPLISYLGKIVR
jgi:hypothetical protein